MEKEIGVALAGGGLQGFSHIGALKALEELGYTIKYISGTSTGSVIASLYAIGYTPNEIEKICEENYKKLLKVRKIDISKIAINFLIHKETRTEGIIDGKIVSEFINKEANVKNIKLMTDIKERKLAIATVDTKTMKEFIFTSHSVEKQEENTNYISNIDVGTAVRASMAFPAIFTTTNFNEYNFIDGGTVDNLPTKVLKDMGAQKVVAISFDVSKYEPSKNLEGVIIRTLDIFSYSDVKQARQLADISIEIYNPDTSLLTMKNIKQTIQNGYQTTMKHFF